MNISTHKFIVLWIVEVLRIGFNLLFVKGYLRNKAIFSHKEVLGRVINDFFYLKKKWFILEVSKFLCFIFKICDVMIGIAT